MAASQYDFGLDHNALAASVAHLGRAHAVSARLRRGLPLKVGILGASVAQNAGCFSQPGQRCMSFNGQGRGRKKGFAVRFIEAINQSWPHAQHELFNGAMDATPAQQMYPCLFTYLPPDVHIAILEFGSMAPWLHLGAAEAIVRRLLRLRPSPAIVFLTVRRFCKKNAAAGKLKKVWRSAETGMVRICAHYNVSCLSLGNAVADGMSANRSGYTMRDVAADCLHPATGKHGSAHMTDLLMNWLLREAGDGSTLVESASLPSPLYSKMSADMATVLSGKTARCYSLGHQGEHAPSRSKRAVAWRTASCSMSKGSTANAVAWPPNGCSVFAYERKACASYSSAASLRGLWAYCYTSLPLTEDLLLQPGVTRKVSPGLVAVAPGALLHLTIDTRLASNMDYADKDYARSKLLVSIDYLTSFERAGVVRVSCTHGCTCAETRVDAHRAGQAASVFEDLILNVDGSSAECGLQLLVLNETSSGGHKFKVRQVKVSHEQASPKLMTG